jgi:hypothetical protein
VSGTLTAEDAKGAEEIGEAKAYRGFTRMIADQESEKPLPQRAPTTWWVRRKMGKG